MAESISFEAAEYQADGSHRRVAYGFEGHVDEGWIITRQNKYLMELGPGYVPVRTEYCGVCSTDLARRFLPYPLPQIIGHEVVGKYDGRNVVVEINASHLARGLHVESCPYCSGGLDSQCPQRITLGIDRLPGGFSPWLLAPKRALIPVPEGLSPQVAALAEPLAATLQGVEATWPGDGDRVAVLGPRRLGMLLLVALKGFRRKHGLNFSITALTRHDNLHRMALDLGADHASSIPYSDMNHSFDLVFDTTGSPSGFETALQLTRKVLHLKSTHGREVQGMNHLSDMVVDELALLPLAPEHLDYGWPIEDNPRANTHIFVSDSVPKERIPRRPRAIFHRSSIDEATAALESIRFAGIPRFDLAIVSGVEEADRVIRPREDDPRSLVRPRGAILVAGGAETNQLTRSLNAGIQIHTSRCGNFRRALDILATDPQTVRVLEEAMITHKFPLDRIDEAFSVAADSKQSIKVLVETGINN